MIIYEMEGLMETTSGPTKLQSWGLLGEDLGRRLEEYLVSDFEAGR